MASENRYLEIPDLETIILTGKFAYLDDEQMRIAFAKPIFPILNDEQPGGLATIRWPGGFAPNPTSGLQNRHAFAANKVADLSRGSPPNM